MRIQTPYKYAVIRVVPRVDRDEFINAGVILFHPEQGFLGAKMMLSERKLQALSSRVDVEQVKRHLGGITRICEGDADAGPIAKMKKSDRFHWLTSPRSTVIKTSGGQDGHGGFAGGGVGEPDGRISHVRGTEHFSDLQTGLQA